MFHIILAAVLIIIVIYFVSKNDGKKYPPGPRGIPYIGCILQLDKKSPFNTFLKWRATYGDLFCMTVFGKKMYVVSDYKMVRELFADIAFSGRATPGDITDMYANGTMHGIINTEGEHWEQLRRFTLKQLRDFGFGKRSMENLIMEELKDVLEWLSKNEGKPITDVKTRLAVAGINSLWCIVSGTRYSHDDAWLINLTQSINKGIDDVGTKGGGLVMLAPWLKHIIPEMSGYNAVRRSIIKIRDVFTKAVEEHKQTRQPGTPRDFIDAFLDEIDETDSPTSAFYGTLGERQLVATIADLFQAGSETTSTSISWVLLYLTTFPEVQKALQEEIDRVVGNSRSCELADRPSMPYLEAVWSEVVRHAVMVPAGVPHRLLEDREYHGYSFPKHTYILMNMIDINHSTANWGPDADKFKPERFLYKDDKTGALRYKKHDAFMPFAVGKRQCAGEGLARDSIFLYTANIFQRYTVKFDPTIGCPGLEPAEGFILKPQPFTVVFESRTSSSK